MAGEVNNSKGEAQKVEELYKEQDELLGMVTQIVLLLSFLKITINGIRTFDFR